MSSSSDSLTLCLRGAREHNLQGVDLDLPRHRLIVVTGVSGSGKSSLAFDTLFREGQRRFMETFPAFARKFQGGLNRPSLDSLEGLGPAVALGQGLHLANPRSTVGTLSELWDWLRLLYSRLGEGPKLPRSAFSFNTEDGACPVCKGLGVQDQLDLDKLIGDPQKTLRQGCLKVSTPNGYLMYSQVTLEVLDQVLRAHGGHVDMPWEAMNEELREVVFFGSTRLKIPFGKHPLENRLKWSGITARPRPDGYYRGLVPIMEEILHGKRNDSILRFVTSRPCETCGGTRLRPESLVVRFRERNIAEWAELSVGDLARSFRDLSCRPSESAVFEAIRREILSRCELLEELGLAYLRLNRPAPSLSPGEAQRLRLLNLAHCELRDLLVVLDEPSAGLHPLEVRSLAALLHRLRNQGLTLIAVDHDEILVRAADWLVELGPGPGEAGGRLLYSGPPEGLPLETPTGRWLQGLLPLRQPHLPKHPSSGEGFDPLELPGLHRWNLKCDLKLRLGALNVVSGRSGAGKTALLEALKDLEAKEAGFQRILHVDASPIGRSPRSNAATYTGAADGLRDLFAASPEAKARGFGKGHFSFNTPGGRCEACEGSGRQEMGMRDLGRIEMTCPVCGGRRFHAEVLELRLRGWTMAELLDSSVTEILKAFRDQPKLGRILSALEDMGLGYLRLGQPATTLSGGEAQRIKLATELAKNLQGKALILLDEPTTGLHAQDVQTLLKAFDRLLEAGHTLVVADHDPLLLRAADHLIDLEDGRILVAGSPSQVAQVPESPAGKCLRGEAAWTLGSIPSSLEDPPIELRGVQTHNLQKVDVDFPARGLTVVTGPSGSGKSSLVFHTLLAQAQNRFAELIAPYARRFLPQMGGAQLEGAAHLRAGVSVSQVAGRRNPRSTLGSLTELDERLRMLFSRAGQRICERCGREVSGFRCTCGSELWASHFSPHTQAGACSHCHGLGFIRRCDPERLVTHPHQRLWEGALVGTRLGAYLGEADGQHMATLQTAAQELGFDLDRPWQDLDAGARQLALEGSGDRIWEVNWRWKRGKREGIHQFSRPWEGLSHWVEREFERTQEEELEKLLKDEICSFCEGERLGAEARKVRLAGFRFPEFQKMPIEELHQIFTTFLQLIDEDAENRMAALAAKTLLPEILQGLKALEQAGLGYLCLNREVGSLSGGEAQRARLASALRGGLSNICYILDEPTQGLHPKDRHRLARLLQELAQHNAVIVIEHDPILISAADWLLEMGPGAGAEGGKILRQGSANQFRQDRPDAHGAARTMAAKNCGLYVSTHAECEQSPHLGSGIRIFGAHCHNLQKIDVHFPSGVLGVVAGPSGSGKSTLLFEVLAPSFVAQGPVGCEGFLAEKDFAELLCLDQEALTASRASSVMSLMGLGEGIRKRWAALPLAKERKLQAKHFSLNHAGARCEACEGRGYRTVAMDLLPEIRVGCELCRGRRFQGECLDLRLFDLAPDALLNLSLAELRPRIQKAPDLERPLDALLELGLGHLSLGREAPSLSAGESQRLRLARLLASPAPDRPSVLLLDEPSRGLGIQEVERLIATLQRIASQGHLVMVIEHHPAFISAASWRLELGPGGGPHGGRIMTFNSL